MIVSEQSLGSDTVYLSEFMSLSGDFEIPKFCGITRDSQTEMFSAMCCMQLATD